MIKAKQLLAGVMSAAMVLTSAGVTTVASTVSVYAEDYDYTLNVTIPDIPWTGDETGINNALDSYFDSLPEILATDNTIMYYGDDFSVATSTSNQGAAQAIITGKNGYATKTFAPLSFNIVAPPEEPVYGAVWAEEEQTFYYDGDILDADEVAAVVSVYQYDGEVQIDKLTRGDAEGQYTITVTPEAEGYVGNAGETYNVKITVNGKEGAIEDDDITIAAKPLADLIITGTPAAEYTYGVDNENVPLIQNVQFTKVSYQYEEGGESHDFTLGADKDCMISQEDDDNWTDAGEQTATITANEGTNFSGSAKVKFVIAPAEITVANLLLVDTPQMALAYTGFPIKPTKEELGVKFYFGDNNASGLVPAEDYDLVYAENTTDVGSYNISVAPSETGNLVFAAGGSSDSRSAYKIIQTSLSAVTAAWIPETATVAAGTDVLAAFEDYFAVTLGEGDATYKLQLNKDYSVAYKEGGDHHDEEGVVSTIVLTGLGNFKETQEVTFTTTGVAWADANGFTSSYETTYDGTAKRPLESTLGEITGKTADGTTFTLTPDEYAVRATMTTPWGNNVNASTDEVKAYAEIEGKGKYAGKTARVYFTINPVDASGFTVESVTDLPADYNYMTGRPLHTLSPAPVVTVKNGTTTVEDFTCEVYAGTIEDGYLTSVVIEATGNYTGTLTGTVKVASKYTPFNTANFMITKPNAQPAAAQVPAGLKSYTDDTILKNFIAVYTRNRNPNFYLDPAEFTITEVKANQGQTLGAPGTTLNFTLVPAEGNGIQGTMDGSVAVVARPITDLAESVSLSATEFTYNGTEQKPVVTIAATDLTNALVENVDFTVTVEAQEGGTALVGGKAINAGTYNLVITGKGNYDEATSITKTFTIKKATLTADDLTVTPPAAANRQFFICDDAAEEYEAPTVKAPGRMAFEEDVDYTITVKAGQSVKATDVAAEKKILSTVTINSSNYESATFDVAYTLLPRTLYADSAIVEIQKPGFVYNESYATAAEYDPALLGTITATTTHDEATLTKGTDFTVAITGTNKVDAEDVYAVFTFAGNYKGTVAVPLEIKAAVDFSKLRIIVPSAANCVYSGDPIPVTVNNVGTETITEGVHYNVIYYGGPEAAEIFAQIAEIEDAIDNARSEEEAEALRLQLALLEELLEAVRIVGTGVPVNVGEYVAVIRATDIYGGQLIDGVEYEITPYQVTQAEFDDFCKDLTLVYNPSHSSEEAWGPFIAEGANKDKLKLSNFSMVTGEATVVLRDGGNYSGNVTKQVAFTVATNVTLADYTISPQVYTGQAIEPKLELAEGSKASLDWAKVRYYQGNVDVSDQTAVAYVVVDVPETEKEFYGYDAGMIIFAITPADIAEQTVEVAKATYTGKELEPAVTVKNSFGEILTEGKDYRIDDYYENINAGQGYVVISGIKNYAGTITTPFTINKAASTIKVTAKAVTYNGKAYTTKNLTVKKTGSTGKVTYKYYSDKACKKAIARSKVKNAGTYYVKATVAADDNYKAKTSAAAKITIKKAASKVKTVKAKKTSFTVAALKKKAQTTTLAVTKTGTGKVTYTRLTGSNSKVKLTKAGRVTIAKGTYKSGTKLKLKVKATQAASTNYKKSTKTVTLTFTVK